MKLGIEGQFDARNSTRPSQPCSCFEMDQLAVHDNVERRKRVALLGKREVDQ